MIKYNDQREKRKRFSYFDLAALIIIILACFLRFLFISFGWPVTNSDEAIFNLMALHIKNHVDYPVFFYGQQYLGAIDAYVGATMFSVFGVSVWSMRMGMLLYYVLFLVCMYIITSKIFSKSFALITLVILGLGTEFLYVFQLLPGYPSLPFLSSLLFLLSYQLITTEYHWIWNILLFLFWGIVAGLLLWVNFIALPYIIVAGLLLVLWRWKALLKWSWIVLLGVIIGAWPLIHYNLTAAPGEDSISIFISISKLGSGVNYVPIDHIISPLFITLPTLLGLYPDCYISALSPLHVSRRCLALQTMYGLGYVILFVIALTLISVTILGIWKYRSKQSDTKEELIRQSARLMLLIGAALTLIIFARNSAGIFAGVLGLRYLICTLVSLPAILWPLYERLPIKPGNVGMWRLTLNVFRFGIILIVCLMSFSASMNIFHKIPLDQANQQKFDQLANKLEQLHITRFYSEYWTCNRLIFQTQEALVCANTRGNLTHGFDRYKPYRRLVDADSNPGFVYPENFGLIPEFEHALASTHTAYQKFIFEGYVIYKTAHRIPGLKLYQD